MIEKLGIDSCVSTALTRLPFSQTDISRYPDFSRNNYFYFYYNYSTNVKNEIRYIRAVKYGT